MRRLIDPYESLGGKYLSILVIVGILGLVAVGNIGLEYLLPARFANPVLVIAVLFCVSPLIRRGMGELKNPHIEGPQHFVVAVTILLVILAVGAAACAIDLRVLDPEQHLGTSKPVVAETHGYRILGWMLTAVATYSAVLLVWRARFVSRALAQGLRGA